jgi:hypothetical protein
VCGLGAVGASLVFGLVRGAGAFAAVLPSFVLVSNMSFAQHNRGFATSFSATSSLRREAKWHVRVSKQSCKQANRLILWGVGGAHTKKNSRFFLFFSPKKLEKYDLTRPKMSKNSLTS